MNVRTVLCLLATPLLSSCGDPAKAGGGTAGEEETPEARSDPWDWIPEDPALVAGREVYLAECALCHNEGEESAPALGSEAKWATRAAKGEDVLVKHAIEGFTGEDGEMPARGDADLSDEEVANAVRYILAVPK